ncbi:MAG TPA: cytochrome c [Candidatus Acidoferrales bacterium]|jgi:mono/diheme cytochrome c family protein|nr:cytochrome c [Candidatus Acidoferrales bacterium]
MIRVIISILLIGAAVGVGAFATLGLQGKMMRKPPMELFPDMDRQAKLRPQEPNHFFANGVSSQLPPAGTVARSQPIQTADGAVYRFEDSPVNTGRVTGTTNFVANNPLAINQQLLERGRDRFDIYCSACHGKLGDGNGITKKIGAMPTVANLHDPRIVKMTDGEIFNTITYGKSTMGAAGPLVATEDRWAIIAYLRALQLSHLGNVADLTPEQAAALKK